MVQLVYRLRTDPRVVCLEKTHANKLNKQLVPDPVSRFSADVSFTSLRHVLPHVFPLLTRDAEGLCLFKPQFEAERGKVGPGGIIAEQEAAQAALVMEKWFANQGWSTLGKMKCPIKGHSGNQEYFYWIRRL